MTLPSTGTLSFSAINVELGRSATATLSINDADVRTLAQVSSGAIGISNMRGKSAWALDFSPSGNKTVYGSTISHPFSVSCVVTGSTGGGTPTYNWYFTNTTAGSWTIQSGQGTNTPIIVGLGSVASNPIGTTINCDVTISGVTKTISAIYTYISTYTPGPL